MKKIQDFKNGLKTLCGPGPSHIFSPHCLCPENKTKPQGEEFTQGHLAHKSWRQNP